MNDLSFFLHHHQKKTLVTELLRDTVDFAKSPTEEGVLFSWRWHFFLGTLPLPGECDTELAGCKAACEEWQEQWRDAGRRVESSLRGALLRRKQAVKFSESSSDTEETWTPVVQTGASATIPSANVEEPTINPLVPASGSSYALQYQSDMVRRTVSKDISRLSWDVPPFDDLRSKEIVADILLKYSVMENREYKQGFHEIVAFLYYACHRDKIIGERFAQEHPALRSAAFFDLFARVYSDLPAAVFALFKRIISEEGGGMGLARWYYSTSTSGQSGVVAACERVQGDLLAQVDPALQHVLDAVYEIQSAVYLVRWLRLIFLREFPLEKSLWIWTAIFCERYVVVELHKAPFVLENSLALYFGAQMLRHAHDLLVVNAEEALRLLMKYPPTERVGDMLYSAILSNFDSPLSRLTRPPGIVALKDAPALPAEVTLHQGEVLSRVIDNLEGYWFREPDATAEQQEMTTDMYIQSIARLKKVRDVLLYGIGD